MTVLNEMMETSELDSFSKLKQCIKTSRTDAATSIVQNILKNPESEHSIYLKIKRLIRGLGGSKKYFRQGCYSCVVCFFNMLPPEFEFQALEDIIQLELLPGSKSKQDEGEAFFGQILAYGAMIDSGYLLSQDKKVQKSVFLKIFDLSTKRSYLHNVAYTFLCMYVEKTRKEIINEHILNHLSNLNQNTLDKLNYLIVLSEFSKKARCLESIFDTNSFFNLSNIDTIINHFKNNTNPKDFKHVIFHRFIEHALNYPEFFSSFWRSLCKEVIVVNKNITKGDEKKFSKSHNNKKNIDLLILHLSNIILSKVTDLTLALEIFNETIIQVSLRNVKTSKTTINSIVNHFSKIISSSSDTDMLNFLNKIFFDMSVFNFDKITGTKLVKNVILSLSFKGVKFLMSQVKISLETNEANKNSILYLFGLLMGHEASFKEVSWKGEQLSYLFNLGFSNSLIKSKEFSINIQNNFFTILCDRFPLMESFDELLNIIIHALKKLLKENDCIIQFSEEMLINWNDSLSLRKKLRNSIIKKNKNLIIALRIILGYSSLMILNDAKTAINNIQDIKKLCEEINRKEEEVSEDEVQWIEVLMDIILNLLSKNSYKHRRVINCVFKAICPHLTQRAFCQIIDVLKPSYTGPSSFEDDNDIVSDENNESSDEVDDEDNEEKLGSEDEEETSDSEDEEVSQDEEITSNEKLRQELRSALTGNVSDVESVDLDDMNEEEGKALDKKLSEIFRSNIKNKKSKREKKFEVDLSDFKMRVLDLIQMCSDVCLPLSYWFEAINPLIDLLIFTITDKKVESLKFRIKNVTNKLSRAKVDVDVTPEDTSRLLKNLIDKVRHSSGVYPDIRQELTIFIKFILRSTKSFIEDLKPSSLENNIVHNTVSEAIDDYFISNCSQHGILSILSQSSWNGLISLLPKIIQYTFNNEVKLVKRLLGLQVMMQIFKNDLVLKKYKYINIGIHDLQQHISEFDLTNKLNKKFFPALLDTLVSLLNIQDLKEKIDIDLLKINMTKHFIDFPQLKGKPANNMHKLCKLLSISLFKIKKRKTSGGSDEGLENDDGTLSHKEKMEGIGKRGKIKVQKRNSEETNDEMIKTTQKKKKHDKKKLKKQSKELRLMGLNDGFEIGTFSSTIITSVMED